jgi:hypothetical protein
MYERRMEDPAIAQNNYVIILNQYLHCSHCWQFLAIEKYFSLIIHFHDMWLTAIKLVIF